MNFNSFPNHDPLLQAQQNVIHRAMAERLTRETDANAASAAAEANPTEQTTSMQRAGEVAVANALEA